MQLEIYRACWTNHCMIIIHQFSSRNTPNVCLAVLFRVHVKIHISSSFDRGAKIKLSCYVSTLNTLIHWGQKIYPFFSDDIFKYIFLNENVWISIKIWCSFRVIQLTSFQHWFRYWLSADQATRHYLKQWWLVYWRICASLGLNELKKYWSRIKSIYHIEICPVFADTKSSKPRNTIIQDTNWD